METFIFVVITVLMAPALFIFLMMDLSLDYPLVPFGTGLVWLGSFLMHAHSHTDPSSKIVGLVEAVSDFSFLNLPIGVWLAFVGCFFVAYNLYEVKTNAKEPS